MDSGAFADGGVRGGDLLDIQEEENVLDNFIKPFENPNFMHIFARFFDESVLSLCKSLSQCTINNV
jgi:hypothetical protein